MNETIEKKANIVQHPDDRDWHFGPQKNGVRFFC